MTIYNFGDILLVGFPFTNLQTTKKRPAVVISNRTYNENRPDIIMMAITSQIRHPPDFGECQLRDWQPAGLLKPSVLKPLIATIEQTRIIRTMGKLSSRDELCLTDVLKTILAGHTD